MSSDITDSEFAKNTNSISRRVVVKSAAWSVPVIAMATAVPFAAASEVPPPATFWFTGATVSVVSGNTTKYTLEGQDPNADPASLPNGSTIRIVPEAGVTITPVSVAGAVATVNSDGSVLYTIVGDDVTLVDVRFRPQGPSGSGYSIITTVPNVDPFAETIDVTLR
ncbi:MAG: hypothetical protein BGN97_05405 [Microbacterium sp. 69-10]|uniref:hypothetical protein n=1 Tax=Microbacterium sp. 69-10 TaxID=1895783 RepID=UPI0009598E9D|nr:hypothetical protein [Microbacterium sp. 69-10]OJU39502.1 MAG: hypothetical protein BGN97_05405 [Microbacterium sp. 69-10]